MDWENFAARHSISGASHPSDTTNRVGATGAEIHRESVQVAIQRRATVGQLARLGGVGREGLGHLGLLVVAGVKGSLAAGVSELNDTLMVPALDEVSTEYGLLAEAVSHPEDFASVTYRLRAIGQSG